MTAAVLEDPPLIPSDGVRTDRTNAPLSSDDDCVQTRPDWPQAEFLAWLEAVKQRRGLKSDNQLALHWGIGHTLISGWRSSKQRPSFETLNKIAVVEGMDARHLWVLAGLVTPGEVGLLDDAQPPQPVMELPAPVVELLDLLDDPRLDAGAREQLLGTVRVLVAGTRAHLPASPPGQAGSSRRPSRKAG